ncbi:YraN family protein [Marivirga sp.]|uniref:YraN family protein n=1 Tax=Marivirga sp. TaxID=2018662 RepID=UPI002D7FC0FE|nr:YraN family protein [Marivirga sp.]HET8859038.1 YraN family protein [Marivirga sp.]
MNTKKIGDRGEDLATKILESKGFEILERNYRFKRSEIDLIALHANVLIFIEVKALHSFNHGFPEERVNQAKIYKLMEAAENYIYAINWQKDIRFDILSINLNSPQDYLHIEDAFY